MGEMCFSSYSYVNHLITWFHTHFPHLQFSFQCKQMDFDNKYWTCYVFQLLRFTNFRDISTPLINSTQDRYICIDPCSSPSKWAAGERVLPIHEDVSDCEDSKQAHSKHSNANTQVLPSVERRATLRASFSWQVSSEACS